MGRRLALEETKAAAATANQQVAKPSRHPHHVLELQRSAGNRAVGRLLGSVQPKVMVGHARDPAERQADEVADQVVRFLQRGAADPRDARRQPISSAAVAAPAPVVGLEGGALDADTESSLGAALSGGRRLDEANRCSMERAFGVDFGAVRLHTGTRAAALNARLQASAFTIGRHIFFRGAAPDPNRRSSQALLAHELAHTVQQGMSPVRRSAQTAQRHEPDGGTLFGLVESVAPLAGVDPAQVALHTDTAAAARARSARSPAVTRGSDVFVDLDRVAPASPYARGVLAHEVYHVAQAKSPAPSGPSPSLLAAELEAQGAAIAIEAGRRPPPPRHAVRGGTQLCYHSAKDLVVALQAELRARPGRGYRALSKAQKTALGPDPYGVREAPDAPAFLKSYDYAALQPEQLSAFFGAIDLTQEAPAQKSDLAPNQLARDASKVTTGATGRKIPHQAHAIWLGGPLKNVDFMNNVADTAARYPDWDFLVWSNVSRAVFDQVRQQPVPAVGPDPLIDVRAMRTWAQDARVKIVSVDEVFSGKNAMGLEAFYKSEEAKQMGPGFAGASDILRVEILKRFGGVYCDGDNVIGDGLAEAVQVVADSDKGLGVADMAGRLNNSAFISDRGNAFWTPMQQVMAANYEKNQRELLGRERERMLRMEVMARTGPGGALQKALTDEGITVENAGIPEAAVHVESAASWVIPGGSQPLAGDVAGPAGFQPRDLAVATGGVNVAGPHEALAPAADNADDLSMLQAAKLAVSTLVRELRNRPGNLHLPVVEPAIRRQKQPDLVYMAVLETIADMPKEAARTTSATMNNIALPREALDLLFRSGRFPNLRPNLHEAANFGNHSFIQYCISNDLIADHGAANEYAVDTFAGTDFRQSELVGKTGWSALQFAVNKGDKTAVLQLLATSDVRPHPLVNPVGESLVHRALMRKQVEIAGWLVEAGAQLNAEPLPLRTVAQPKYGYSPAERTSAVQVLVTAGGVIPATTVDKVDKDGYSALTQAVETTDVSYVRYLLNTLHATWKPAEDAVLARLIGLEKPFADLVAIAQEAGMTHVLEDAALSSGSPNANEVLSRLADLRRPLPLRGAHDPSAAGRQAARFGGKALSTHKDAYKHQPAAGHETEFLLKGLAYANDHIQGGKVKSGDQHRVKGWITGIRVVRSSVGGDQSVNQRSQAAQRTIALCDHVLGQMQRLLKVTA